MATDEWRLPPVEDGEEVLWTMPGQSLPPSGGRNYGIDCTSHAFRLLKAKFGGLILRVKHGGGVEQWNIAEYLVPDLGAMSEVDRFRYAYGLADVATAAARAARDGEARLYRTAFVEGRLMKRKERNQPRVSVWIEPASAANDAAVAAEV